MLGINQSTMSRRISGCESALKTRLVERHPEGVMLTEAGQAFARLAEETETGLQLAIGNLGDEAMRLSGPLSIACVDMMADQVLSPLLSGFCARHPNVELSILTGLDAVDLMRGKADVALRVSRGPDSRLMGRRLCDFGLGVYQSATPANGVSSNGWISWADSRQIEAKVPNHLQSMDILHYADSFMVMRAMVRAGLGMAVLPCYWADADQALQRVVPQPVSHPDLGLWVLYHPDRKHQPRLRSFVDYMSAKIVAQRDMFAGTDPAPQG